MLEGYILHEVRAALATRNLGGELSYFSTTGSKEIDLIWRKGEHAIGIEVKAARTWRNEYARVLNELVEAGHLQRAYVVYRGNERLRAGHAVALPVREFLDGLHGEELLA